MKSIFMLAGVLCLMLSSSGLNSSKNVSVSELYTKAGGRFILHGKALGDTKSKSASFSDNTGSITLSNCGRCDGYGRVVAVKEGQNFRALSFRKIEEVQEFYQLVEKPRWTLLGLVGLIEDSKGNKQRVRIVASKGDSMTVTKTSNGYERL